MNPFRILPLVLASGLMFGLAPPGRAAHGVVDLSWGACSPIVSSIPDPAPGPLSLIASQLGNDQTHTAYQVVFQLGAVDGTVPDAWRFDDSGCGSSSRIAFNSSPPTALAKTCPAFKGPNSLMLSHYGPFPVGSETVMRGLMAVAYPPASGPGPTSVATQRTFLAEFVFDHAISVEGPTTPGINCGGFETPIVIGLVIGQPSGSTVYLGESNLEYAFEPGNTTVTVNGTGIGVPAAGATWGQIKNAYRR
jgi:hypothetical protein